MFHKKEPRRRCLHCRKMFTPKTARQYFHVRKCYMLNYRKKQKENKYPIWICPKCRKKTQLDFHPKMNIEKWRKFQCSHCGCPREENKL